jgi:hypothetical protein
MGVGKTPPIVSNDISYEKSRLGNEAGALIFQTNVKIDSHGSAIPEDTSFIQLQDKWGSYLNMNSGKLLMRSTSEMSQYVGQNYFQFVGGHAQYHFAGDKNEYIQGNLNIQSGRQGKNEIEAARKMNEIADSISNATVKAIESNSGKGDRLPCDICSNTVSVDRASRMVGTAFKYIRKVFNILPNSPFGGTLDKIQKVLATVMGFFLDELPISSMNGGSCKSSGCKNNTIASPLYAIQKGNEAATEQFNKNKKQIEQLEKKLSKDTKIETIPNTLHVKVGLGNIRKCETIALVEPNPMITELEDGNPKWAFIPSSRGTCKRAIFNPPTITDGIDFKEITGEYIRKVGSGGISMDTTGKVQFIGSTLVLGSSKGEVLLNSPNKTIIGGANIVLDTKGNPNGDAIILDSDRTYVGGKLSVQGDIALKGSLMMDGGIYVPHITCPGERIDTDVSSSAHNVHSSANWNNPMKPDATKMDLFDKIYKKLRDICASLMGLVLTPDYLKTIIEETYSTASIAMTVDGQGLPTGFAMVYDYTTFMPLDIVGSCTYGGSLVPKVSVVVPAMIPVYSYTHNHGSPGDPHVHAYTALKSVTHGNAAASIASRQPASSIPTPPLANGMGSEPGHKNAGDLGPCGGGGGYFGNPNRVNSAKLRRNKAYGINGLDAFNTDIQNIDFNETTILNLSGISTTGGSVGDFININPKFTEDGELIPPPDFYLPDCP